MKTGLLFASASALLAVACGSSPAPSATRTTAAAVTVEPADAPPAEKSSAEKWAEQKVLADAKSAKSAEERKGGDPLAMNDALEDGAIPKIDATPAKELRTKSRADLDAALAAVKSEASVEDAAKKLTARLGKPTWTENGTRRIWVSAAGAQCHRLVLETDGTVEVETASKAEWRMLAATAKQNPCTGEIKRGIEK